MESLRENKLLMYAIMASSSVVILLTTGLSEDLNNTFEIIQFPDDVSSLSSLQPNFSSNFCILFPLQFQKILIYVLLADTILAYVVDRVCSFVFSSIRRKSELVSY